VGYTWEFQRRGALHLHVILRGETAHERHQAHLYVAALDRLRHPHRFGFVDRGRSHGGVRRLERISARRAGSYLAKYLAPMEGGKMKLSDTASRDDAPSRLFYMSRSLTTVTGITMRNLRYKRAAWMRLSELGMEGQLDDLMEDPHNWRILATGNLTRGP
jgi:hypothetical protein